MRLRPLGQTGLSVSEIGIGAWQLGGPLTLDGVADGHPELGRDHCIQLIRDAGELGINFIDTAEQYGDGESERRVGEALKGHRDHWIISTKFGHQVGPNGERVQDASPRRVPISLEGSLRRLQTDYLDVYLYHIAPRPGEAEEVAGFLNDAKAAGKVRAVGISATDPKQVEYLHSLGCLDAVQYVENLMRPHTEMTQLVRRFGAGGIVRGAFYGGRLSGRYFRSGPDFAPEDIRARLQTHAAAEEFARYAAFEELLTPERGMIQLALRAVLDDPATSTVIPGGKSLQDYREAIRATELPPLTGAENECAARIRARILAAG